MWELVSFIAGLLVFTLLVHLIVHVCDIPKWVSRAFRRRGGPTGLEARIVDLERRLAALEGAPRGS
jgi:hypothetical protein